jgi:hypothetical protein
MECIKVLSFQGQTTDQTALEIKKLEKEYKVERRHIVIDSD